VDHRVHPVHADDYYRGGALVRLWVEPRNGESGLHDADNYGHNTIIHDITHDIIHADAINHDIIHTVIDAEPPTRFPGSGWG
jgi:hypothetical protein